MAGGRNTGWRRPLGALQRWAEGHRTLLGLACAAGGLVLAGIAWTSVNGVPFQDRYTLNAVVPRSAPILKEGDAVRIGGKLAGQIVKVDPGADGVHVEFELDPAFAPVGRDARTYVRVKSIIYLTYLEVVPGDRSQPLAEGETIEVARSGSGVDLLEVVRVFDRRTREALGRSTYTTGVGVAGRGEQLNAGLADLAPAVRDGGMQLEALTADPGALARSVAGASGVASGLRGDRDDDVAVTIGSGATVAGAIAARDDELGRSLELLAPFEREVEATGPAARHFLAEAELLARDLDRPLADLAGVLPQVNETLALGDRLRERTAMLTEAMNPVLAEAAPVLWQLYPTVASIEPLLASLDELTAAVEPYQRDITRSSAGLISATSVRYDEGATASGSSALRFVPVLTCHRARNPYPAPGQALEQEQGC